MTHWNHGLLSLPIKVKHNKMEPRWITLSALCFFCEGSLEHRWFCNLVFHLFSVMFSCHLWLRANCILSHLPSALALLQLLFQWRDLRGWDQFLYLPVSSGLYGALLPHGNQWVWFTSLLEQRVLCGQPRHIPMHMSFGLHGEELPGGWWFLVCSAQPTVTWTEQQQEFLLRCEVPNMASAISPILMSLLAQGKLSPVSF